MDKGDIATLLSVGGHVLPATQMASMAQALGAPRLLSAAILPAWALGGGLLGRWQAYDRGNKGHAPATPTAGHVALHVAVPALMSSALLGGLDWAVTKKPTLGTFGRALGIGGLMAGTRYAADYLAQQQGFEDLVRGQRAPLTPSFLKRAAGPGGLRSAGRTQGMRAPRSQGGTKPMREMRPGNSGSLTDQFKSRNQGLAGPGRPTGSPLSERGVGGTIRDMAQGGFAGPSNASFGRVAPAAPAAPTPSAPAPKPIMAPTPKGLRPRSTPAVPGRPQIKLPQLPKRSEAAGWVPEGDTYEEVGLFIRIPERIARLYPERAEADPSPPHITLLVVGDLDGRRLSSFLTICRDAFRQVPRATARYGELTQFPANDEGQVPHAQEIQLPDALVEARARLVRALKSAGFTIKDRWTRAGSWVPHTTLAYLPEGERYTGPRFTGSFPVEAVEIWKLPGWVHIPLGTAEEKTSAADGPGLLPSLFLGVRRGLTAPFRMYPGLTAAGALGGGWWGMNTWFGEPAQRLATAARRRAVEDHPAHALQQTFRFGSGTGAPERFMPTESPWG